MKNNVTVVKEDNLISVDGYVLYVENIKEIDFSPNTWRAIQYHDEKGEIEFLEADTLKNMNFTKSDYIQYVAPFVQLWEEAKYKIENPPLMPLEEFKVLKQEEINAKRDLLEISGFEYLGSSFDTDEKSYLRILGADNSAAKALQTGIAFEIEWTLADNSKRVLLAEEILGFIPAFASYSNSLHVKANELKQRVKNALTHEEVQAIVWE